MNYSDDIDKAYVSPFDKFFYKFDENHPKSASQLREIAKHIRIANLRDGKSQSNVCNSKLEFL